MSKFKLLETYNNVKEIYLSEATVWFLKQDGCLYGAGYGPYFNQQKNVNAKDAIKIVENVKEFKSYHNEVLYITEDNKLYLGKTGEIIQLEIDVNENTFLLGNMTFINNGELFNVNSNNGNISKILTIKGISSYYNKYDEEQFFNNTAMSIFKINENKIYVKNQPNITKIGEKSNYNLRKVFENAIFVQGKGSYISIVDKNGKIYESTAGNANIQLENTKKIISSNKAKYVIKNDGTLWAKGGYTTGMWGKYNSKNDYSQVTKDGTTPFNNVKEIYTSKVGSSAIFITEDHKIYWAGSASYIVLPNIQGDYNANGSGVITNYPKEVTSNILEQLREKIKDIKHSFISKGGVNGCTTLILTEDGKLYTMSNNRNMSGNNTISYNNSGDFTELTIKEGTTVKQILTEDGLSLALLSNGEVYGWGYNTYGILGQKYEVGEIYPTPVKLEGLPANIRYMSLGNGFAIFASKSGEVYGIGKNDYGQLGTGDNIGRTEFVRCTKLEE